MTPDDRGSLIGPIVTEILQGIRRETQASCVASLLRGIRYLETTWVDWAEAAGLGRRLAGKGRTLPLSDLILASVSLRLGAEIYSTDPHFDGIPELKRFLRLNRGSAQSSTLPRMLEAGETTTGPD